MMSEDAYRAELLESLQHLKNLNPDIKVAQSARLDFLGRHVGAGFFETTASLASELIDQYLHSPIKIAGAETMKEYFDCLEQSTRLLRSKGEIQVPLLTTSTAFSTALVPREQTDALDFCKILNRSQVPKPLVKAADAFRRRNQVVESIFIYVFRVMWLIDEQATSRWLVQYFQEHDGSLDPDIVRDALASALAANVNPSDEFLTWSIHFAADPNLLEYWPMVTRCADRLLCRTALVRWSEAKAPRNTLQMQLVQHVRHQRMDEDTLLGWCRRALDEVGGSVQRFMSLEASGNAQWRSAALMTELHRIANLYEPVMLVIDQLLVLPDGASLVAMAFLGLAGESLDKWEAYLEKFAERAVRRTFILDLKLGRKTKDTLSLLTFGDTRAYNTACSMLDLMSEKFDSIAQREKAVAFLSVFYASYRRPQLLGSEISKRYRNLMRMLHVDFLHNELDEGQFADIEATGILQEIASVTAEARRFLGRRRAADNSLEEMMGAKISFERFIREKRIAVIRQMTTGRKETL